MDFKNILHNKLFLWGAGGLLLFVVIFRLLSHAETGAVTTTTSTTTQPTDAQVQAQTSLALAQIDAATQANTANVQLAAQTQQLQEQLAEKGIDADVAKYTVDASNQATQAQIDANAAAQERDDDLQASIAKWTLDQQTAMNAQNDSFQLAYANQANQTTIATAQIVAGVNLASIQAQEQTTIASLQASTAQITSEIAGQVQINQQNDGVQIVQSDNNASVQKHGQTTGLIGSIAGGILGIFSDRRLKTDVILLGRDPDGLGRYAYRYRGDRSWQAGVMADEVAKLREWASGPRVNGYATVRYAAL